MAYGHISTEHINFATGESKIHHKFSDPHNVFALVFIEQV